MRVGVLSTFLLTGLGLLGNQPAQAQYAEMYVRAAPIAGAAGRTLYNCAPRGCGAQQIMKAPSYARGAARGGAAMGGPFRYETTPMMIDPKGRRIYRRW